MNLINYGDNHNTKPPFDLDELIFLIPYAYDNNTDLRITFHLKKQNVTWNGFKSVEERDNLIKKILGMMQCQDLKD